MEISVIIPARDEAENIAVLLRDLRAMKSAICEIIVCDGGSRDATIEIAKRGGARVLACEFGNRGAQMNAGAAIATGEVTWFLHADARVCAKSAGAIQKVLNASTRASRFAAREVVGGNFVLRFDDNRLAARLFKNIARVQRRFGVYYGDSGIWVRRETFRELGGFRAWPLFEDLDFARRLERHAKNRGANTACLRPPIRASSRRFANNPWKLLATWILLQTLFGLGVSPRVLAKIYHRRRTSPERK